MQPPPQHRVCPNSGAWLFHPGPEERALEQIQQLSAAMLKAAEALNNGQAVPVSALTVMRDLGR